MPETSGRKTAPPSHPTGTERPREPVWYRPAWVTAMVALVSAFLTVPDVIGDYYAKEQDIEIAKQQVEAARLGNLQSKQSAEFDVVQNTLSKQGDERIFILRYFAATLDDPEARGWAEAEVIRLDRLVALQGQLERERLAIQEKEREIRRLRKEGVQTEEIQSELALLQEEIEKRDLEVAELRQQAGIQQPRSPPIVFLRLTVAKEDVPNQTFNLDLTMQSALGDTVGTVSCFVSYDHPCELFIRSIAPERVRVNGIPAPFHLVGRLVQIDPETPNGVGAAPIVYECNPASDNASVCRLTFLGDSARAGRDGATRHQYDRILQ